ncbi:MAG: anthranilate synthase component I [Nitrospirae bacterium]|nr:MAG: anthranilate synthase component I [Nitrospirota bacterium]
MFPDRATFLRLARKGNLIPVYQEVLADLETPVSAYLSVAGSPSFLLESVEGGEKWGRYSILSASISRIIRARGERVEVIEDGKTVLSGKFDDPLKALSDELERYRPVEDMPDLPPFYGGLVGYMGYEMVRFFERVPDRDKPGLDLPDMFFMVPEVVIVFDNLKHMMKVIVPVFIEGDPVMAYDRADELIRETVKRLREPVRKAKEPPALDKEARFESSFGSRSDFESAVKRAKEYVHAGDVVQVVLSQRFDRELRVSPLDIYRALRVINPSPYMYYIDTGEAQLIGSSPEILVRLEGRNISLRPIAGTRRRGRNDEEDRALERELREDPKEIAEHIMLVDLGRNDVGRVAEIGSVRVTELMSIERYSHVMHLVSNVVGKLRKGSDAFDLLRACFPAGTVTGAPKVRAMEIIDELEPVKRGPYAGAVGYFSYSGNMDTCITIRTIISKGTELHLQAGAGIVADSVPELEYKETVNKAMGMMKAVDMAERGL